MCFRTAYNFVFFGHNLYTPADIRLAPAQIPAGERPYAAWAYIGFHRELHLSAGLGNLQIYAGAGVTARIGWFRASCDSLRQAATQSGPGQSAAPSSCQARGR